MSFGMYWRKRPTPTPWNSITAIKFMVGEAIFGKWHGDMSLKHDPQIADRGIVPYLRGILAATNETDVHEAATQLLEAIEEHGQVEVMIGEPEEGEEEPEEAAPSLAGALRSLPLDCYLQLRREKDEEDGHLFLSCCLFRKPPVGGWYNEPIRAHEDRVVTGWSIPVESENVDVFTRGVIEVVAELFNKEAKCG